MTKIEQRRKLLAEATPGPWVHCQPFMKVPAVKTIHGPVKGQRVDFVSTRKEPPHKAIIIPMEGRESFVTSENMALIVAAVNDYAALLEIAHTAIDSLPADEAYDDLMQSYLREALDKWEGQP